MVFVLGPQNGSNNSIKNKLLLFHKSILASYVAMIVPYTVDIVIVIVVSRRTFQILEIFRCPAITTMTRILNREVIGDEDGTLLILYS